MSPRFFWSEGDVRALAVKVIAGLHHWVDFGRKVTGSMLVELLASAAALGISLSRVAKLLEAGPSDESVRNALHFNLPDLDQLKAEVTAGLRKSLPRGLRRAAVTVAIDYHKRPYYGNVDKTPGVRGGKEKAGTRWFFTYATAAIVTRGERFTVALEPVFHGEKMEVVLERLWRQMARIPLKIKRLLLDREFCAADVIHWLQRRQLAFILPLIRRGKLGRSRDKDQGNARFFRRGMRGIYSYEWQPRSTSRTSGPVKVLVACVPRGRRRPLVYIVSTNWQLKWIQATYEGRFSIECSYRQLGQALALTTTHDLCWRLLLVAIALLMGNVWVLCHQLALTPGMVTLETILLWIVRSLQTGGSRPCRGFYARSPPATTCSVAMFGT